MCSNQCNDAAVLSMLDTVHQGDLYNTYNPPKIFLPLTSQFKHRIVDQLPQITNVNNTFDTTLTYENALNGAKHNGNISNPQREFLNTTFAPPEEIAERIDTTIIQEPFEKDEEMWQKCKHDKLGTILIPANAVCPESSGILQDEPIVDTTAKLNYDALLDSIKKLQNIKIMIDNNEDVNELGEYALAWVDLVDSNSQTRDNILKFKETSNELLGMQLVKVIEKNIILDKTYSKVIHIKPDVHNQTTLHEFLKYI